MTSTETSDTRSKRTRRAPRTMEFTELGLRRLNVRTALAEASKETGEHAGKSQLQIWDTGTNGQRGLSVLLPSGGTKTFLVTFYLRGRPVTAKLGRVGEISLQEARTLTVEYRAKAQKGIDPRPLKQRRRAKMNEQEAEAEQEAAAGTSTGTSSLISSSYTQSPGNAPGMQLNAS